MQDGLGSAKSVKMCRRSANDHLLGSPRGLSDQSTLLREFLVDIAIEPIELGHPPEELDMFTAWDVLSPMVQVRA